MSKTEKRVSFALSKEDSKELDKLSSHLGEGYSAVIRRALILLHYVTFYFDNKTEEK
jgi:hypothetical protein